MIKIIFRLHLLQIVFDGFIELLVNAMQSIIPIIIIETIIPKLSSIIRVMIVPIVHNKSVFRKY